MPLSDQMQIVESKQNGCVSRVEEEKVIARLKLAEIRNDLLVMRYKEELYDVYRSKSWRYTAIFRKIGDCVRWIARLPYRPAFRKKLKNAYHLLPDSIKFSRGVQKLKDSFL